MIEIEEENRDKTLTPLRKLKRERQVLLKQSAIGETGERVVIRLIFDLLFGGLALGDVANESDDAGDIPFRIVVGTINARDPAATIGARNVIEDVRRRDLLAAHGAREKFVHMLLAKMRKDFRRHSADHVGGRQSGHESIEDDVAKVAVVNDDAFAGVLDDFGRELMRLAQRPLGAHGLHLSHDDVESDDEECRRDDDLGRFHVQRSLCDGRGCCN